MFPASRRKPNTSWQRDVWNFTFPYLPSGTAIIPADKTDEIINNSTSSSSVTYEDHSTFSPTISITLGGETTKADAEEIVRRVKQAMEDFWQEKKEEEYHERTLQGAYAQ